MNIYRKAMEACPLPEGLEERLREQVLSTAQEGRRRTVRPWTMARKVSLAAVVAVALSISAGAAGIVDWDVIFTKRFGRLPPHVAANAFQNVHVTARCDDVTLTIREAVGDGGSLDYILDYQIPDTLPAEVYAVLEDEENMIDFPTIEYFSTDEVTWEDYKAGDGSKWAELDWADYTDWVEYYMGKQNMLDPWRMGGNSHGSGELIGYDPESRTLTYLFHKTIRAQGADFTDQPLTLLATPPFVEIDGENVALAEHPALIMFQPAYRTASREGTLRDGETLICVTVSSLAFSMEYGGPDYEELEMLVRDTVLIRADGSEVPVSQLGRGYSGGVGGNEAMETRSMDWSTEFQEILDPEQVTAVRVGDLEIPLQTNN